MIDSEESSLSSFFEVILVIMAIIYLACIPPMCYIERCRQTNNLQLNKQDFIKAEVTVINCQENTTERREGYEIYRDTIYAYTLEFNLGNDKIFTHIIENAKSFEVGDTFIEYVNKNNFHERYSENAYKSQISSTRLSVPVIIFLIIWYLVLFVLLFYTFNRLVYLQHCSKLKI